MEEVNSMISAAHFANCTALGMNYHVQSLLFSGLYFAGSLNINWFRRRSFISSSTLFVAMAVSAIIGTVSNLVFNFLSH